MFVQELWRYPVKSIAGERLDDATVELFGLRGDRNVHVRTARNRAITARTYHKLLGLKGTMGISSLALIDGQPWNSPEALKLVRQAAGPDVELVYDSGLERFDVLPLLVATDGPTSIRP